MSNLNGVSIEKGKQGANILGGADSVSGMIIGAPAPASLTHDVAKVVFNMRDVEALGITEEYDTTNKVNVYRHAVEFYRTAGEGTELYIMVVDPTTTMSAICETKAKSMLPVAKGKIKQLAIAINVPEGAEITMLNGIPENVYNAIPKAQALALWAFDNHMPCQVFLEGYNYGGEASSVAHLREIENVTATKVSVFIGQDYKYAKTLTGNSQKFADVGTLLGVCAKAKVHQNVGNNEEFNITDATKDAWMEPGVSSHTSNDQVFEDLQTLEEKGFLFGVEYTGMAGVRINNDHVCTPIVVDADNKVNEHTIAYGRVMDKAVRGLRTAYLPKVKTDWVVNKDTGKIPPGVVVALENIGDKVFEDMEKRGEITYGKTSVDKDSDLIVSKELKVSFVAIPKGSIGEIKGTINLKTQV